MIIIWPHDLRQNVKAGETYQRDVHFMVDSKSEGRYIQKDNRVQRKI